MSCWPLAPSGLLGLWPKGVSYELASAALLLAGMSRAKALPGTGECCTVDPSPELRTDPGRTQVTQRR